MFDWIGQRLFRLVHERNLVYASCWEDPAADRIGLQITPKDTILTITSAGCNALDYLIEDPVRIVAVDVNFRQNALLELKRAAIHALNWQDVFAMFGKGHHPQALTIYRDALRQQLIPQYQCFWDKSISLFCGAKSFYFRTTSGFFASLFRHYIDNMLRVRDALERLLEASTIDEQISVYEKELKHKFWGPWLGFALRRDSLLALSGIPPQQRRQVQKREPDIQRYMQRQAERVIYHHLIRDNYFWRVYLTGEFTPDACPRYLQREHFDSLRSKLDKLTTHTSSVREYLEHHDTRFSCFVLLDHMDWLSSRPNELAREWQAILNRSHADTRILWRSLGTSSEFVEDSVIRWQGTNTRLGDCLVFDRREKEIWDRERVTAYGCVRLARWQFDPGDFGRND
jgi:S-adenosylmethionine-diacylglycerol 3-amino-3-carboxypropyl transferase